MTTSPQSEMDMGGLPAPVERSLRAFTEATRAALGPDLRSLVLFGSAAEGRLRPTSDVNLIVVLAKFEAAKVDALREPLRTAHAAIQLSAMFLLENELAAAVESFAVKFGDVLHRRRVLFGSDPFTTLRPTRAAEMARLRQVLLNLTVRLRQQYLLRSLRDEQAVRLVAETAGPLRACAASLLELRGTPAPSPKEALDILARGWSAAEAPGLLRLLSDAREQRPLAAGTAAPALLRLMDLAAHLRSQAEALGREAS